MSCITFFSVECGRSGFAVGERVGFGRVARLAGRGCMCEGRAPARVRCCNPFVATLANRTCSIACPRTPAHHYSSSYSPILKHNNATTITRLHKTRLSILRADGAFSVHDSASVLDSIGSAPATQPAAFFFKCDMFYFCSPKNNPAKKMRKRNTKSAMKINQFSV